MRKLTSIQIVKKSDSVGSDFYYMGDMEPVCFAETETINDTKKHLPAVRITFSLKTPVEEKPAVQAEVPASSF